MRLLQVFAQDLGMFDYLLKLLLARGISGKSESCHIRVTANEKNLAVNVMKEPSQVTLLA